MQAAMLKEVLGPTLYLTPLCFIPGKKHRGARNTAILAALAIATFRAYQITYCPEKLVPVSKMPIIGRLFIPGE